MPGLLGTRQLLCCLGGTDEEGQYHGDVAIFDVDAKSWLPLRAEQSSDVQAEEMADAIMADRQEQSSVIVQDVTPRIHHTATVVETDLGPMLFVVGGYSHANGITRVMGTLQILDLRSLRWSPRFELPQRYGHAAVLVQRQLLIVGGRDELGADVSSCESLRIDVDKVMRQWCRFDASGGRDTASLTEETYCEPMGQHGEPPEEAYHGHAYAVNLRDENALFVGRSASGLDLIHLFNPRTDLWVPIDDFGTSGEINASEFHFSDNDGIVAICRIDHGGSDTDDRPRAAIRTPIMADIVLDSGSGIPSSSVARDYEALLGSPTFSKERRTACIIVPTDFVLQSTWPDAAAVHVHKLILLSRLPHFSSLLSSDMEEALLGIAKIDEPYEVVYALAAYLYTDRLPSYLISRSHSVLSSVYISSEDRPNEPQHPIYRTALRLLHLSNLYTLPHLFHLTAEVLLDNLSTQTAPYIFSAAALLASVGPDGEGLSRVSQTSLPPSPLSRDSPSKDRGVAQIFLNDVVEWCSRRAALVLASFDEVDKHQSPSESGQSEEEESVNDDYDSEFIEPWARQAFMEEPRIAASLTSSSSVTFSATASKQQLPRPSIVLSPSQTSSFTSCPSTPRSPSDNAAPSSSFSPFLAHVSAKLQLQADYSINRRRSSGSLTPTSTAAARRKNSPRTGAGTTAAQRHLLFGARSGRVTPSLGDLVGGRLSPSNATGRFEAKDLALDHAPLAF